MYEVPLLVICRHAMVTVPDDLPQRMNAATYFVDDNVEAGRGDRIAICNAGDGSTFTYNDVLAMTNRTGNALRELGVRREERVMLLVADSPEFAFCFFGAIKIGAVPVPINTMLKPDDFKYLLNDSRAPVLVVSEPFLPQIQSIRNELRYLDQTIVIGQSDGFACYDEVVSSASTTLSPELLSKDDVCFWLYSSGTTAFPKAAVHLQHDMVVAADLYAKPTLGINANDRCFSVAKLFFAYGLGNGLYFPFRVGASTILYPAKADGPKSFEIIRQYKPTLFFSVPTGYASMLSGAKDEEHDLGGVRHCVSAGESLPSAMFERWKDRFGVEILDGIGSTEILHIFISNRPGRVKPGATGEIVPGYEGKVVDEQGVELPDGEVGDLHIKGDSICAYYWNSHEANKKTFNGPWIRTGDKYLRDQEGYYWYQGRGDDMLKVGGIWVSPIEVENLLIQHPGVLESAVIGVTDVDGLVKPKAYVVLKNPSTPDLDKLAVELQNFVRERTARYKYPRWVEFVPALPKTATGKTRRFELRNAAKSSGK